MLTEIVLGTVTETVFGYLLEKVDPIQWAIDWTTRQLGGEPDSKRRAFQQALAAASRHLEIKHAEWAASLFDSSFFQHEAAPILAQFLLRNGNPHPQQLVNIWADSLGITDHERRQQLVTALEPVAVDFLHDLGNALKGEPALAEINDSRALERMVAELTVIRSHFQSVYQQPDLAAARAAYLDWLIDRNLYLDPRGTFQTQRQVQLKLDDVYIGLRAQIDENPNFADRRFLEQELTALARQVDPLSAEEQEDRYEQLYARLGYHQLPLNTSSPLIDLNEVVQRHDKLVILGDPGSGKTTLLRYLALQQASHLRHGRPFKDTQSQQATLDLKFSHFPVFIRVADYAEDSAWKRYALSDFLAVGLARLECNPTGLANLLQQELNQGGCLVLLDGLDEIVEADHRRSVVQRIEDFVRRYDQGGLRGMNRFIVSSRIAGYRSAPLTGIGGKAFAHYVVQEMDDDQIKRFLERWCRAVEDFQTPDLAERTRQATAQREIDGILAAVQKTPGVRRLAANPLMLRVLALIHRTGARLPQKRVELYKLATDTLGSLILKMVCEICLSRFANFHGTILFADKKEALKILNINFCSISTTIIKNKLFVVNI
jgi:energy-coupling factor transporter ATP-binding protein EcfA2